MISNYADLGDRFNTPVDLRYSSYHTSNQLQSTIVKYSPAIYKLTYIKYTCMRNIGPYTSHVIIFL